MFHRFAHCTHYRRNFRANCPLPFCSTTGYTSAILDARFVEASHGDTECKIKTLTERSRLSSLYTLFSLVYRLKETPNQAQSCTYMYIRTCLPVRSLLNQSTTGRPTCHGDHNILPFQGAHSVPTNTTLALFSSPVPYTKPVFARSLRNQERSRWQTRSIGEIKTCRGMVTRSRGSVPR